MSERAGQEKVTMEGSVLKGEDRGESESGS